METCELLIFILFGINANIYSNQRIHYHMPTNVSLYTTENLTLNNSRFLFKFDFKTYSLDANIFSIYGEKLLSSLKLRLYRNDIILSSMNEKFSWMLKLRTNIKINIELRRSIMIVIIDGNMPKYIRHDIDSITSIVFGPIIFEKYTVTAACYHVKYIEPNFFLNMSRFRNCIPTYIKPVCSKLASYNGSYCVCPNNMTQHCLGCIKKDLEKQICSNGYCEKNDLNDKFCKCNSGYEGRFCCAIDYCKNRGWCDLSFNETSIECKCPQGFSGKVCQCRNDSCSKHGVMNGNTSECTCSCKPGYSGDRCDCTENYCLNKGRCVSDYKTKLRKCECKSGYIGSRCECKQNSTCIRKIESSSNYECVMNYEGSNCSNKIDYCVNGQYNSSECICNQNYYGERCLCSDTYCSYHGKCKVVPRTSVKICVCSTGFIGARCKLINKKCMNGGVPLINGDCNCTNNYFGNTCLCHQKFCLFGETCSVNKDFKVIECYRNKTFFNFLLFSISFFFGLTIFLIIMCIYYGFFSELGAVIKLHGRNSIPEAPVQIAKTSIQAYRTSLSKPNEDKSLRQTSSEDNVDNFFEETIRKNSRAESEILVPSILKLKERFNLIGMGHLLDDSALLQVSENQRMSTTYDKMDKSRSMSKFDGDLEGKPGRGESIKHLRKYSIAFESQFKKVPYRKSLDNVEPVEESVTEKEIPAKSKKDKRKYSTAFESQFKALSSRKSFDNVEPIEETIEPINSLNEKPNMDKDVSITTKSKSSSKPQSQSTKQPLPTSEIWRSSFTASKPSFSRNDTDLEKGVEKKLLILKMNKNSMKNLDKNPNKSPNKNLNKSSNKSPSKTPNESPNKNVQNQRKYTMSFDKQYSNIPKTKPLDTIESTKEIQIKDTAPTETLTPNIFNNAEGE